MERESEVEARFVLAGLLAPSRDRQRGRRRRRRGGEPGEMRFDHDIAGRELLLIDVEELEVLLEHEEVFGAVVPGESRHDVGFGCPAAIVAMLRQM